MGIILLTLGMAPSGKGGVSHPIVGEWLKESNAALMGYGGRYSGAIAERGRMSDTVDRLVSIHDGQRGFVVVELITRDCVSGANTYVYSVHVPERSPSVNAVDHVYDCDKAYFGLLEYLVTSAVSENEVALESIALVSIFRDGRFKWVRVPEWADEMEVQQGYYSLGAEPSELKKILTSTLSLKIAIIGGMRSDKTPLYPAYSSRFRNNVTDWIQRNGRLIEEDVRKYFPVAGIESEGEHIVRLVAALATLIVVAVAGGIMKWNWNVRARRM